MPFVQEAGFPRLGGSEQVMPKPQCLTGSRLVDGSFVSATLGGSRGCPARSDFIELFFVTGESSWTWCFPEPPEQSAGGSAGTIALAVGPYGAQARSVDEGVLGLVLPTSEALPMILGGCQIYVARKLVERGW
ncbi:hypothetical protein AN916_05870 [Mycobacteroides immunogenum]|nr:hypothetical protein AN916_05870 [Mycobacteroides immunogenum]